MAGAEERHEEAQGQPPRPPPGPPRIRGQLPPMIQAEDPLQSGALHLLGRGSQEGRQRAQR